MVRLLVLLAAVCCAAAGTVKTQPMKPSDMTMADYIELYHAHPERFATGNAFDTITEESTARASTQRVAAGPGRPFKIKLEYNVGPHISVARANYLKNKLMPAAVTVLQQYIKARSPICVPLLCVGLFSIMLWIISKNQMHLVTRLEMFCHNTSCIHSVSLHNICHSRSLCHDLWTKSL